MIKATDVRIDNWIIDGKEQEQVTLRHLKMILQRQAEFDPIPLTSEVLQKCGFTKHVNSNEHFSFYSLPGNWYVSLSHHNEPSAGVKEGCVYYGEGYLQIDYLHDLQNLYYVHTKKELTYTP